MPERRYLYIACIVGALAAARDARADDSLRPSPRGEDEDRRSSEDDLSPGDREYGAGDVSIYSRYARTARGTSMNGLTDLATVGLDAHGLFGKRFGYAFALGFDLGGGVDGSFAYSERISPAGFGISIGSSGYLMALCGVGFDGATSRIPLSVIFPTQALLAFDVRHSVRLGMNAGIDWVTNDTRAHGARVLGVGDELDLGTFVRIGRSRNESRFHTGRGYFFRLDRKGQLGTSFIGFSIGLELDAAG